MIQDIATYPVQPQALKSVKSTVLLLYPLITQEIESIKKKPKIKIKYVIH